MPDPVPVAVRLRGFLYVQADAGERRVGARPHFAWAQPECPPEEAAEVRFARETQREGDLVDAAMVGCGIGQFGIGAGQPLILDVVGDATQRLEQPVELSARDSEQRAQRFGMEFLRSEGPRDMTLDAFERRRLQRRARPLPILGCRLKAAAIMSVVACAMIGASARVMDWALAISARM